MVKNLVSGRGCPAAFMITTCETQYPIIQWLRWLASKINFRPQNWMIDCSDTEIAAIRSVHGPDVSIFICHWHVTQAVIKQSKEKLSSKETNLTKTQKSEANKLLRNKGVKDFIGWMHSPSPESFEETWHKIQQEFLVQQEWIKYLRKQWLPKKEQWGICWRKVSHPKLLSSQTFKSDSPILAGQAPL